jgi:hypothetical protein
MRTKFLLGSLKRRDHSKDLGEEFYGNRVWGRGLDSRGSG